MPIDRRSFLRTTCTGLSGMTLLPFSSTSRTDRPNILFLLTDDQRWDSLGCMGNPIVQTPHIDHLALQGTLFENNFTTTAICCTSRATLFTGRYGSTMDLHRFDKALPAEAWQASYPMLLRQSGYRTGFVGKFGIGDPLPDKDFDYWDGFPGQGTFYEKEIFKGKHLTQAMTESACHFLEECGKDQPFCLSVSYKAPHSNPEFAERIFPPDERDRDLYKDVVFPPAKTGDEAHRQQLPEFIRESEGRIRRLGWYKDEQETTRDYFRLITGVDRSVGDILATLQTKGLEDNTVIIFTGDNGYFLGEKGFEGKWFMYEESIRTPLLIRDPRLPAHLCNRREKRMTLNLDMAPTLLDLAGLPAPAAMKGRSLLPLVQGEQPAWREEWYYEHLFPHPKIPRSEGVRTGKWKYIRYMDIEPVYEELYNLESDPHEEHNLAGDPAFLSRLEELRTRCARLKAEATGKG